MLGIIRQTRVYAQSESLELIEEPISEAVEGDTIELDGLFDGLKSGRWLMISGERILTDNSESGKVKASELVMLTAATQGPHQLRLANGVTINSPSDTPHTTLHLANSLAYKYKRDTVTINANVAHATQGETRTQVLGSGDGSKALQEFKLNFSPLTHVASATPNGVQSTLEVRVNDVLWREKDELVELGPRDHNYITRRDNEENTFVIFGNGVRGARLPTGVENVKAVYRQGIGKAGNVAAEQISLLATRPLGVKGVINRQAATGGADPEDANSGRRNTAVAIKALGRAVSVQDYADFARAFAGIGKTAVARFSDGRREVVHLTIAGDKDIPISKNSDLYRHLQQALLAFGDPHQPLQIDVREALLIVISARVKILPEYLWENVEPRLRATLLDAFGFDNRELGQHVLRSEIISVIEAVEGVDYVDIDRMDALSQERILADLANLSGVIRQASLRSYVPVELAKVNLTETDPDKHIRPAQLAYLTPAVPDTLILTEIKT
jgi:predicted phage baseplate assembly protein